MTLGFHSASLSRERIGFRSKFVGFVWYPGRVIYGWLRLGPWLIGRC